MIKHCSQLELGAAEHTWHAEGGRLLADRHHNGVVLDLKLGAAAVAECDCARAARHLRDASWPYCVKPACATITDCTATFRNRRGSVSRGRLLLTGAQGYALESPTFLSGSMLSQFASK